MIKLIQPISRIYFYNHELHEFHELGEPWRLLGNHLDGAFAKKAKNSCNSCNSWSKIKISAQSAQSFRRNLFYKDISLRDD